MSNQVYIRWPCIVLLLLHGREVHSLPKFYHNSKRIVVNGCPIHISTCILPSNYGVLKRALTNCMVVFFLTSTLALVKVRSPLLTQIFHNVIPLSSSHILKILLSEEGVLFPKIRCCQSRSLFALVFVFMVLMVPMEKFHSTLQPQNLCVMVSKFINHTLLGPKALFLAIDASATCSLASVISLPRLRFILGETLVSRPSHTFILLPLTSSLTIGWE